MANADLDTLQKTLYSTVSEKFGLKVTDFAEYQGVDKWSTGDWTGECEWSDETTGSKLTGVSRYSSLNNIIGKASYSLDGWMGPSLINPHMLLSFGVDPSSYEGLSLSIDYLARGPTPIGSDNTYMEMYYSDNTYDKIASLPTAKHLSPVSSLGSRLLRSPQQLSVSGLSLDQVTEFATNHVEGWVKASFEAEQVQPRQRGAINNRDDKLRQYFYQGFGAALQGRGCDIWRKLAAGSTGPLAEAYVGGGS
jgi:hypothetical protein